MSLSRMAKFTLTGAGGRAMMHASFHHSSHIPTHPITQRKARTIGKPREFVCDACTA